MASRQQSESVATDKTIKQHCEMQKQHQLSDIRHYLNGTEILTRRRGPTLQMVVQGAGAISEQHIVSLVTNTEIEKQSK